MAVSYFLKGFNCAQSVLLAMCEHWEIKSDLIPKVATAFGGGIGGCGSVCGALTGGVMALGMEFGTNEPSAKERMKSYKLAQKLCKQFEKQNGTMLCRDLVHYDLSNPKELEKAREAGVFENKCTLFVKSAVEILLEITGNSH